MRRYNLNVKTIKIIALSIIIIIAGLVLLICSQTLNFVFIGVFITLGIIGIIIIICTTINILDNIKGKEII